MKKYTFANFALEPGDDERLQRLSASKRDLITGGESMVEIAERLRVPVGTVKSRKHRARAALLRVRQREVGSVQA